MEDHWSSAKCLRNFPRQKKVLCMWCKMHILHFYFVGQMCSSAQMSCYTVRHKSFNSAPSITIIAWQIVPQISPINVAKCAKVWYSILLTTCSSNLLMHLRVFIYVDIFKLKLKIKCHVICISYACDINIPLTLITFSLISIMVIWFFEYCW